MKPRTISELESRLLRAPEPESFINWNEFSKVSYITTCELTRADIAGLISIARLWGDYDWLDEADESFSHLPILAWRALAELKATEAVKPLLQILNEIQDEDESWCQDDFPVVAECIGESIIPTLVEFANVEANYFEARIAAIHGLIKIAKSEPHPVSDKSRKIVVNFLSEWMQHAADKPQPTSGIKEPDELDFIQLNVAVLQGLLDLKVSSAAPQIEKAFSENQLDVGYAGDWSAVSEVLGVDSLGLSMPDDPINSMDRLFKRMGVGIFSDRRLSDNGEPDDEAIDEYYENAMNAFGDSPEGGEVTKKFGSIGWIASFLEISLDYLAETVDTMSVSDAEEVVFEIIPRKFSTGPESAESIIYELRKFWEFIDRVYHLKNAPQIIKLFDNQATKKLRRELADPANFGMAKSFFMQGVNAGFDMTSQTGLDEFMGFYNANLASSRGMPMNMLGAPPRCDSLDEPLDRKAKPAAPKMSAEAKKAFNKKRKKLLAQKMNAKKAKK